MGALAALVLFVLAAGVVTLLLKTVLVLLAAGVAVLLALVVAGKARWQWHLNRPVPCRVCGGSGLHDAVDDVLLPQWTVTGMQETSRVVELCLTCGGSGNFAPSLREAIGRDAR